jgi:hypothetical protein
MTQLVLLWAGLGIVTLAMALYRKILAMREDPYVHIAASEQRMIPQQVSGFKRIRTVDDWGIALTIMTVLLGLVLAGMYVYQLL